MKHSGISIVVCCYNSAQVIGDTLLALGALKLPADAYIELVLVNNNCTDRTVEVTLEVWNQMGAPFPLRIVEARQPGLNFARKAGVISANYEFVLFCDDDNWLSSDYAVNVIGAFESNPELGIVGGWSVGKFEGTMPPWFPHVETAYAVGGEPPESVQPVSFVFGSAMAIRRELGMRIFENNLTTLDRVGTVLTSGGDAELCERCLAIGYSVAKLRSLRFTHFIKKERLTWSYCIRLFEGFSFSSAMRKGPAFSWRQKLSAMRIIVYFILTNPLVFWHAIRKTEGDLETIRYFSLQGTVKAMWLGRL